MFRIQTCDPRVHRRSPSSPRGRCTSCFTADKSTPSHFNDGTQPLGSIFHLDRTSGCVCVCVYVHRCVACVRLCLCVTRWPPLSPSFMIVPINPGEQGSRYRHPTWKSYFTYPCLHLLYPSSHLSMSTPVPPLSSSHLFFAAFLFPLPSILLFSFSNPPCYLLPSLFLTHVLFSPPTSVVLHVSLQLSLFLFSSCHFFIT